MFEQINVLANRHRLSLPNTIAITQATFVEGRQILDTILITTEVVGEFKAKKRKDLLLKLDYEPSE